MIRIAARLALALSIALIAGSAPAQQWTRFRGPNGDGQSEATAIPAVWSEADYNWRVELPGRGHGSVVLWGQRIFLTTALGKGETRVVLCLDAKDGKQLWRKDYPAATHAVHQQNSYASSTPAVDKNHVYVAMATPEQFNVIALSHDGAPQWKADLGPFVSQHGFGTSPIVYQDMVVIGNEQESESSLVALDCAKGHERWRTPRRTAVTAYSTPCVYQPPGRAPELIFNSQAHGISGVNPLNGKTNWEIEVFDKRSVSSPIVVGDLVFGSCGSGAGGNYVVAVRPGAKPEIAYKVEKSAPYVPTSVARGELLFLWADNGIVTCIKAASGEQVWQKRVGGSYSGSPVRAGDKIINVTADGDAYVLAADKEYKLLGQNKLGETCRSTPAIADGVLYVRSESHLLSIGRTKLAARN